MALLLALLLSQAPLPANHPAPSGRQAPSADELIKRLDATPDLKSRLKSFEIAASLGRLYFGQGRYQEGATFYGQAMERAEPMRARFLELRPKRTADAKKPPVEAPLSCRFDGTISLEELDQRALQLTKEKGAAVGLACMQTALEPIKEVEAALGMAQFLSGHPAEAKATLTKALSTFDDNAEALYARGAVLLDAEGDSLDSLRLAKSDFERFLALAPAGARAGTVKALLARTEAALSAGGLSKTAITPQLVAASRPKEPERQAGQPPVLSPETIAAFQNAPRTAEMDERFTQLIATAEDALAQHRYQDALDGYKQVMPFQPDNARLRAGMAWTMVMLNRQPMADRVWGVALQNPEAIETLGDVLKSKGDAEGAKAVWSRLKDTRPDYASKLEGKL